MKIIGGFAKISSSMLAEARAQAIHFAARTVAERLIKPVPLTLVQGATLESARVLDHSQGNYLESANHYHSVLRTSATKKEQADALIGLSQQLINLGSFRQVRELLKMEPERFMEGLSDLGKLRFSAQSKGKEGWVNDYELGFFQSRGCFSSADEILTNIPKDEWTQNDRELHSTSRHFLGRAAYGLAALGVDRDVNARKGIEYFREAMDMDREFTESSALKIGFGHGWLARCHLLLGSAADADVEIEAMGRDFRRQLTLTPGRGLMAQYYVLKGLFELQKGIITEAGNNFKEAIRIRTEVEPYPKGLADAYLGMAKVSLKETNPVASARYVLKAVKAHPYSALRGIIGA